MSPIQEDYILCMIQMIGDVTTVALGLNSRGQTKEADQKLANVLQTILAEHADLIKMVEETTAVSLQGDLKLGEAYVDLLLAQSEIKISLDEVEEAELLRTRAIHLLMSCIKIE